MQRTPWLAVLAVAVAFPAAALAQTHSAEHFLQDDYRYAVVDDNGGTSEGHSVSIDHDEDGLLEVEREDFCPHCRIGVLVSDPGLAWDDLELLGLDPDDIRTLEDLADTIGDIATEDPEALATELQPALEGADYEALVERLRTIIETLSDVFDALNSLSSLESLDWSSLDVSDLADAMGIRMDTAFTGRFNDVNDRERYNSGVGVYTADDWTLAAESGELPEGVPEDYRDDLLGAIQALLDVMPWAPAMFELSGDDENVLEPVVYHARYTDLTVRQRTYVANGMNIYLGVYTIVNDSDRVLPFVEVAMFADFDIPPHSHDLDTQFEFASQTVLVHDVLPYEDPEIHWYYGLAPALPTLPTEYDFAFANYNLDDQLTLTQAAASSEENRLRFFLWHPDMTGDHDEADGKSEKQGAVSLRLPGPMMPGEAREFAFCFAGNRSDSESEAMATTLVGIEACRAVYNLLHPNCGDTIVQFGEECDDGNVTSGDGCSTDCQAEVCGDGVMTGAETCDDGNAEANDGCGPTCQIERCGDGVVQATEECDDGNDSSTDSCLTTCFAARCGDGVLRGCESPTDSCGCAGYQYCWSGRFRITENQETVDGEPNTGAFDGLVGVDIQYLLAFDVTATTVYGPGSAEFTTGPVHVELIGHPDAAGVIAPALEGSTWSFSVGQDLFAYVRTDPLRNGLLGRYSLQIASSGGSVAYSSTGGVPDLRTVRFRDDASTVTLTRFGGRGIPRPTDVGTGSIFGWIGVGGATTMGEACDDGNASDFDLCTTACIPAACGDGFLQVENGEQCDDGPSGSSLCTATCTLVHIAACGDGTEDPGEGCDDGNDADGDGCSSICRDEVCGDGILQATEECDDGANGDGDGCTDGCLLERCGDGVVQTLQGEACDSGPAVSDTAECLSTCQPAACGDGHVLAGVEECDDGDLESGDGCSALCVTEVCGDGLAGPDEECDDGNAVDGDGCSTSCRIEVCGDRAPGPGEQCDDGNAVDGDGCDKDCQMENLDACGDSVVGRGEECDDGGRAAGDGCSEFCQLESPEACGNGNEDPGEQCDDGNAVDGDGCSARCVAERCGDGLHTFAEACDDGNVESGDGCSSSCEVEEGTCGNGVHEYGEQCDDGNESDDDGCTSDCGLNPPGFAPHRTTCGNGDLDLGEECDDGGRMDGDGCDETCQVEPAVCGNARLERGETCDDGNQAPTDGCGATCRIEGCGNGALDLGEACDDGNVESGDGCSSTCRVERCGDGVVQPGEECDLGTENGGEACSEDCTVPAGDDDGGDEGGCDCSAPGRASSDDALLLLLLAVGLSVVRLAAARRR